AARSRISRVSRVSASEAGWAIRGFSLGVGFRDPSLPRDLVQQSRRCRRGVQARDVAGYRQADPGVATLLDEPLDAGSLAADDDAHGLGEIEVPCQKLAAWVERDAPDAGALDLDDR